MRKLEAVTTAKPTILQIIPRLDTGGAELSTIEITVALVRARARALVLSEGGRLEGEIAKAGGTLLRFSAATKNPAAMAWNGQRIAALVRAQGVDLLHARSRAPAWSALLAARKTGKPLVTTYHGAYGSIGRVKTLYNSVMARGDAVIANSLFTAHLIAERHLVPPGRVHVIHRGVDLARFDPAAIAPQRLAALRDAWRVTPADRIVLHAARLTGWKGQRVLIEATAQLAAQGGLGNAVVIMAGDAQGRDGYAEELRMRIAEAGLDNRVRLVGHCADMAAAFALAYVAVVPSTEPEAFGRAAAEALAMGCPVVAADHGAPPEILAAGEQAGTNMPRLGWRVRPGDATALAEALRAALDLPPAARAVIHAPARAHVEALFTVAHMQRATLAVYDRLLGTTLVRAFDER